MKEFTSQEAQSRLSEVISASHTEPVLLTDDNQQASVLLSQESYQALLQRAEADPFPEDHRPAIVELVKIGRRQIASGDYTPMQRSLRDSMDAFSKKMNV